VEIAIQIGGTVGLLLLGFFAGHTLEKRHFRALREREERTRHIMAVTLGRMPGLIGAHEPMLVTGAVCVSIDYFKRFIAGIRFLFGGRVGVYETVTDRARREAILRMKECARAMGYEAVICVRIETARIAGSRSDGKGTAGMEVVAYGTAVRFADALPAPPVA
jgi:uncharacterized protein YbjQ (UPF0145 family)